MQYKLAIIGTGNVATALGSAFAGKGHEILQVYGRDVSRAATLAAQFNAAAIGDLKLLTGDADLYIIAVSDNAIPEMASSIRLGDKLVVHTAGSVSKEVLKNCSTNYGVLYPVQSLRSTLDYLPLMPFLVDANTAEKAGMLRTIAGTISEQIQQADDEQRLRIHVAAVIVSNFTNHLYALAEEYCKKEGADFRILQPLIAEVANRIQFTSPRDAQTGPAIRHDQHTINKHLGLLESFPQLQHLYIALSESIQQMYK